MRFNCHGCSRTIQVRGAPPIGAKINVTCPDCRAVNRCTVPRPGGDVSAAETTLGKLFEDILGHDPFTAPRRGVR